MVSQPKESIVTKIWHEEPESDNPFAARISYCSGFDVYGDLLGKIGWVEYLWLLLRLEPPQPGQARMLEALAVGLANPGPREPSVHAAMCAGVGGSTRASALIAALSVGAGNLGGARDVFAAMHNWVDCGTDLEAWRERIRKPPVDERDDVWPPFEHPPGFDPNGAGCPMPVRQLLNHLTALDAGPVLPWLQQYREALQQEADAPLAFSGVAAAALHALDFTPEQGVMLFLLLRLPGAAAHAVEQDRSWAKFPFFGYGLTLTDDPGPWSPDHE
jgi:citrate synthase